MHFIPLLLLVSIFLFWWVVGYATLSLLQTQRNVLKNMLIAPIMGISVTILPIFWINRIGIPIKDFGLILTIILLISSLLIIKWRKPVFAWKKYLPFTGIFILAFILTGRPLIEYGFNWISFANDDMANYCLGAMRFYNYGYSELADLSNFSQNKDFSIYFWFMHIPGIHRAGSELFLAWLASVTQLSTIQIFMTLIFALYLSLLSAVGALILQSKRNYKVAIIATLFLAGSALTSLSVLYQLIAQVGGVALMCGLVALFFRPFNFHYKHIILRQSLLISILAASFLIFYPEISPLVGISALIYFGVLFVKGWRPNRTFLSIIFLSLLISLVMLNTYWINVYAFLQLQTKNGFSTEYTSIFPYFLVPSGFANLWGLQPLAVLTRDPLLSIYIAIGIMLTLFLLASSIYLAFKKSPSAIFILVMTLLAINLFIHHSGFGLFKLTMYMQPFIMVVIATALLCLLKERYLKVSIITFFCLGLYSQYYYIQASGGPLGYAYSELPSASITHLISETSKLTEKTSSSDRVILDTPHVVSAKIITLSLIGKPSIAYSNHFFKKFAIVSKDALNILPSEVSNLTASAKREINASITNLSFSFQNSDHINLTTSFVKSNMENGTLFIKSTPLREVTNRWGINNFQVKNNYDVIPFKDISNHLIFINSTLGQHYYLGQIDHISLNNLEKDPFFPNGSMAAIGHYLLFQIINPKPHSRVVLNITNSLNNDGSNKLPPAIIIGNDRIILPLLGRGSARIISSETKLRDIKKNSYFLIDMGRAGKRFPNNHTGLMKSFGEEISLDSRYMVSFARDISFISSKQYEEITPPISISKFPEDLGNQYLEYSGMYEDGWISEDAYFILSQPAKYNHLVISGMLPKIKSAPNLNLELTVYCDEKKVHTQLLQTGQFKIEIPIEYVTNKHKRKIRLHFSESFPLSHKDKRLTSSKLEFLGFSK